MEESGKIVGREKGMEVNGNGEEVEEEDEGEKLGFMIGPFGEK